jgi:hypothetical protein
MSNLEDPKKTIPRVLLGGLTLLILVIAYVFASAERSRAQQPEEQSSDPIALPGTPIPPDHSKLSEHNIEWLKTQPAQVQMEFLLSAAINHDEGATDLIAKISRYGMASCSEASAGRTWRRLRSTPTISACVPQRLRSILQ